jgi:hypothetical protein
MIRTIPPVPPEFTDVFRRGGWELVELLYGGRTDLHRKWVKLSGARCRRPKGER